MLFSCLTYFSSLFCSAIIVCPFFCRYVFFCLFFSYFSFFPIFYRFFFHFLIRYRIYFLFFFFSILFFFFSEMADFLGAEDLSLHLGHMGKQLLMRNRQDLQVLLVRCRFDRRKRDGFMRNGRCVKTDTRQRHKSTSRHF